MRTPPVELNCAVDTCAILEESLKIAKSFIVDKEFVA